MKEKKKIFWIIGLSLILLTICIIGIIVIKNIYMKDKYIDEDGKATTIDTPQGDVYEEAKYSKEKVANSTYFYSIEKCINNYLNAIKIGGAVDGLYNGFTETGSQHSIVLFYHNVKHI